MASVNARMMAGNKSEVKPLNMSDVEMIFGKPDGGKNETVHMVVNEKRNGTLHPVTHGTGNGQDSPPVNQPLLEPDRGKQAPPLAGPEIDDLDDEKPDVTNSKPYPGVDDGLLDPDDKTTQTGSGSHHDDGDVDTELPVPKNDEGTGTEDDGTRFEIEDRVGSPLPGLIPDVNTYQQKKNLAQGMMDLALFTANTNQLRYVIETSSAHPYYYFSLVSISFSLILQIAVGIGLILNSRYNVKDDKDICKADKINNMTVLGIFLITIVNVFIAAFSVAPITTAAPAGALSDQQAGS
ncbi:ninjurin-A isoform X2 [Plodia interpunctella]|uniref:ninjurin-A isoform X2 n=1 Tax=Plodia interpunctella TaxID=58824 RepID=UPI0023684617|nr:ninjurin-A isoform X2 [Plodia interpunctella]